MLFKRLLQSKKIKFFNVTFQPLNKKSLFTFMNCAPFYGQYKKVPKRLISGPGIVPGPFSLAPI
ncbi:hypothetical protein ASG99_24405, partial [Bacillus sp. Soil768D1]